MKAQDWETGTPKKNVRELDSTDCKRKSKLLTMSAQRRSVVSRKGEERHVRAHHELSSDDEEELKHLSKTIKKLHFEERSEARRIEEERQHVVVSPFEIIDERIETLARADRNNPRRPTKKDSFVEAS